MRDPLPAPVFPFRRRVHVLQDVQCRARDDHEFREVRCPFHLGRVHRLAHQRGRVQPSGIRGILPRALVWGLLGLGMKLAMTVFAGGVPIFLQSMGMENAQAVMGEPLSWTKVFVAFCISVTMNSIFAPVFMTLHKITDTHILQTGGTLRGFFTPIHMGEIMTNLNWRVQWGFVFKKTIPLFWFPAHTVTFLLPGDSQILCAALLGIVLGVLLAVAALKK